MTKLKEKAGRKWLSCIAILAILVFSVITIYIIFQRVNSMQEALFSIGTLRGDIVLLELVLFFEGYLILFFVDARYCEKGKNERIAMGED